jgi:tripartite-type tricarboxylate transporter receptor subunit TctC
VHVTYKGNAEVVTNLAGGHVLAGFLATPGILPQVRAGRVKALASSGLERLSFAPEVPTISENGYPGCDVGFYEVMMAPARLPEPIRAILEREVKDALQAPDLQARLRDNALDPVAYGSVETTALLKAAAERWHSVITRANIRLD